MADRLGSRTQLRLKINLVLSMSEPSKFRLDRAISMCIGRAIASRRTGALSGRVPILMYHGINTDTANRHPYFETNTSPKRFRDHLSFLARNDYRSCDLGSALAAIGTDKATARDIVITFDDGYADFYDVAYPLLLEYGFSATVFVVTDLVGIHRFKQNGREYMSWQELRQMQAHGIRVGSHTASHGNLALMTCRQIEEELRRSKEVIEDNLATQVKSFAYPYAFPEGSPHTVNLLRALLEEVGYVNGVCTIVGTAWKESDPYFLPRLPINTFDDEEFLRAKLTGGYEWLHALQYGTKVLRSPFNRRSKHVERQHKADGCEILENRSIS